MNRNAMLFSVIIPVFNEALTVVDVINRVKTVLQKIGVRNEIIVIDDCSTDRSAEISRNAEVKVYSLKEHMGKGIALRAGFVKARGDVLVTVDSDGSHRPEELLQLLTPILMGRADLVIGSRFLNEMGLSSKRFNAVGVRLFNFLIKILTKVSVSDSQSGYRVMKSMVLANLNLKSREYEIESEMLVKIAHKGFRVMEVPICFEQRTYGTSRLDPLVDGFKILLSILTSYLRD
jgi:glycosyltransferase involved in cell wall biosynthesis